MQRDAQQTLTELRVDGGASVNNLLLQFQADLLGVPVLRPTVTETTALGAAYLAGLGSGYWSDQSEVAANWRLDRRFEPMHSRDWAGQRMAAWAQAVRVRSHPTDLRNCRAQAAGADSCTAGVIPKEINHESAIAVMVISGGAGNSSRRGIGRCSVRHALDLPACRREQVVL
jgi:hypothetical protein